MELFATIGFIATVRTKPVQQAIRFAWSRYAGTPKQALPDFKSAQDVVKFQAGSMLVLSAYATRARAMAVQGRANLASVLATMKNRIKNPVVMTTESSQTTVQSSSSGFGAPYGQFFNRKFKKASSDQLNTSNASSCYMSQVNAQQNNLQQNNYGLFHWYSNAGRSYEWAQEFGKKRFWQGFAAGGFGMAWLMKPNAPEKERTEKASTR